MDDLTLWYGEHLVGTISGAFESDGTWSGRFQSVIPSRGSPQNQMLCDFIEFCEDWNERTKCGPDSADPAEFDVFRDLLESGKWAISDGGGQTVAVVHAPVFFRNNEVSWRISVQ